MQVNKGNGKSKKDIGKWCEFHKSHWHSNDEYHSIQSLVAKIKDKELNPDLDPDSKNNKRRQIIDVEPTAIVATATIQPEEDPKEGEQLLHSQMWVKGTPLHFIVDSGSQKNIISEEFFKKLDFPTTPHPRPYNIGWLHQGQGIFVNQECRLSYDINPFKDEVLCDVSPLEICDVLLCQPYMWRCHVVYESQPHRFIFILGGQLYKIPEVVSTIFPPKQCHKVISYTVEFSLFTVQ
jgi:hypothetical protein